MVFLSCENIVLWRGHFNATGLETSVNLSINGGEGNFAILPFLSTCLTFNSLCRQCMVELAFPRYFIWQVCTVHLLVTRWLLIDVRFVARRIIVISLKRPTTNLSFQLAL